MAFLVYIAFLAADADWFGHFLATEGAAEVTAYPIELAR
jgi:hypothetical protein